jgi:glycosyltransferase involved in cell wall biosynthesis
MENNLPKISIVTPSFNDCEYLERTILSVLSQNYPNLEYIVIDGGSTDGSVDIIKKYKDELTYWQSEADQGMYYALQRGFDLCTGEVMGWINSDDLLHPGSLFTIGQVFGDYPFVKWLQGLPNAIDESNRIVHISPVPEVDKLFLYQKKHIDSKKYIQQESTYWHRSLWEQAGGYISHKYKYAGDFELWIRFFQYEKIYNLNALTGTFRASKSGQASVEHYVEYVNETLAILNEYPLSALERKKIEINAFFEKFERMLYKIKAGYIKRKKLDPSTVINNKIMFDAKLQKFIFIDK